MIYTKRFLFLLAALLLPVTVLMAQQPASTEEPSPPQQPAPPTFTPIPAQGSTPVSSVPGLPTPITLATLSVLPTQQPAPGVTPAGQQGGVPPAATSVVLEVPASSSDACPTVVLDAYNATALTCPALASGEVCLGNGVVEAAQRVESTSFSFANAGDKTRFADLSELQLRTIDTSSKAWTVVLAQVTLNSTDASAAPLNTSLVILGDVVIADDGTQVATGARLATVIAASGSNVRRAPDTSGVVVWQLAGGEQVTVTGRTADAQWIRIEIPSRFGGTGWVYAPYLDVEGGAETLPYVTVNSARPDLSPPEYGHMQAINLLSGTTATTCVNTPDSGILLQSPSGLPLEQYVKLRVNDVQVLVNGTVFIQAQPGGNLTVSVLEGSATVVVGESAQPASTGSAVVVALNAQLEPQSAPVVQPYNADKMAALPINLVPREFGLPGGTIPDGSVVDNTGGTEVVTLPIEPTALPVCILTAVETPRNVRISPSTNSDIVGVLQPGETIEAIGSARDGDGFSYIWYETAEGFMRFDTVQASDSCTALTGVPLPVTDSSEFAAATATAAAATPEVVDAAATTATISLLSSGEFGELCGVGSKSSSFVFPDGVDAATVGGTWTATAGTTATFGVGDTIIFRGEFGDYMQLVDGNGTMLARSGESRTLSFKFEQNTTFGLHVIASKGDFVVVTASCTG